MSRFFSEKYAFLEPYKPGEQPQDKRYIKLNTNESPFPISPLAAAEAEKASQRMQLYPDPECGELVKTAAAVFGVRENEILFTNGSDETLNFAFMAYCDESHPAVFPNITYGFYPVFAEINALPYVEIPLREDFTIWIEDYFQTGKTIFLANPNAPTGIALRRNEIEEILKQNRDSVVVLDEAYVDFGAESCIPLIRSYDNLLVIQTFSKSRSMAGARLGFAAGNPALIEDLRSIKYSTNPYRCTERRGIHSKKLCHHPGNPESDGRTARKTWIHRDGFICKFPLCKTPGNRRRRAVSPTEGERDPDPAFFEKGDLRVQPDYSRKKRRYGDPD